jgi:hypothetical protein
MEGRGVDVEDGRRIRDHVGFPKIGHEQNGS